MASTPKESTMTPSQRSSAGECERLLKAFLEVQRIRVTPDSLRMWLDALGDLTPEQLQLCLRRFNREGGEFPNPAAVRKFAGDGEASIDDRALLAWASVRRSISRVGAYESIEFDDRIINAAIRNMGGWINLCDMTPEDATWREKEFVAAYKAIIRTGIGDGAPLNGINATANGRLGHKPAMPRRITTGLAPHQIAGRLNGPQRPRITGEKSVRKLTLKSADD